MKTTININLFGTVYAIDEDAHQLLTQYIENMKSYFAKQTGGDEIVDDIEHRVAELFWELKQQGHEAITLDQVKEIIQKIGNPEQMEDEGQQSSGEGQQSTVDGHQSVASLPKSNGQQSTDGGQQSSAHDQQSSTNGQQSSAASAASQGASWFSQRRFFRDPQDKLIGGVISGATHYFGGKDPLPWRIGFIAVCLLVSDLFFYLFCLYLLFWLVAPEAHTAEERLRMQGKPVNPDSIRSQVLDSQNAAATPTNQTQARGCLASGVTLFAVFFKIMLFMVGLFFFVCVFIPVLFALCVAVFNVGMLGQLPGMNLELVNFLADQRWALIIGVFTLLTVCILPIYALFRMLRSSHATPLQKSTKLTLIAVWIAAFLATLFLGGRLSAAAHEQHVHFTTNWDFDDFDDFDDDNDNESQIENSNNSSISFTQLTMKSVGKVIFHQADSCTFRAVGTTKLVMNTNIEVVDDKLMITPAEEVKMHPGEKLTIYVTAPNLTQVHLDGVGEVKLRDNISQSEPMEIKLEGVGKIDADDIECPKVMATLSGVGKADLNVNCDSLFVKVKGVGKMEVKGTTHYYEKKAVDVTAKLEDDELVVE